MAKITLEEFYYGDRYNVYGNVLAEFLRKDTSGEFKIEQSVYKSMTDILYPRLISFYNQPHILEEFEQW